MKRHTNINATSMKYADVFRAIYPIYCQVTGRPTYRALEERDAVAARGAAAVAEYRLNKLKGVLENAYENVPFYNVSFRSIGFNPKDVKSFSDFEQLDFSITKSDVRDNVKDFISTKADRGDLSWHRTGGSTGDPLVFPTDRATDAASATALMRALRWWGVEYGAAHAQFWGSPTFIERRRSDAIRSVIGRLRNRAMNRTFILNYNISESNVEAIHNSIVQNKPEYVRGMPTSLYVYAQLVKKSGLPIPHKGISVVFSACEQLYDWQKSAISEVFGTEVANTYGLSEVGDVAYQSPSGHMKLMDDDIFTELVPFSSAAREIVTTQLNNFASPLIKYRTGDLAESIIDVGGEGGDRAIAGIQGRAHDVITAPDGRFIHGQFLTHILVYEAGIVKYQIVQNKDYSFSITLQVNGEYDKKSERSIEDSIRKYVGKEIGISFSYLDEIPLTAAGKHRWIISHVDVLPVGER